MTFGKTNIQKAQVAWSIPKPAIYVRFWKCESVNTSKKKIIVKNSYYSYKSHPF